MRPGNPAAKGEAVRRKARLNREVTDDDRRVPLPKQRWLSYLNTRGHRTALIVFLVIVLAHWAEHVVQAVQIWVLDRPCPTHAG